MKSSESVPEKVINDDIQIDFRRGALQRIGILILLILTTCFIVYITPMPEKYFESCDRPCHELDWPMICRVKLTLEVYKSLSRSCKGCPSNTTDCNRSHCVSADGYSRGILAANRLLPGPSIQVCENDIMVIDVVNRVPGQGVTLHWRGQPQQETPFMDGVPMVTQCPIPSYTTFQYKFRAANPGTHLYHAHSGAEAADGLFGAFIVRKADTVEPQKQYYDYDLNEHVMVISEWSHGFAIQSILDTIPMSVASVLVNGKGVSKVGKENDQTAPLSVFTVKQGSRYRFRVAHAGGVKGCPLTLSIDEHPLTLIALDGKPIKATEINTIILGRGERADFVLNANKEIYSYNIVVSTIENCATPIHSAAVLQYEGKSNKNKEKTSEALKKNLLNNEVSESELNTVTSDKCYKDRTLCVSEVQSLTNLSEALTAPRMQTTLYLPFRYMKTGLPSSGVADMDGVTFTFPSSPLLTQDWDVPEEDRCTKESCVEGKKCECVHIKKIALGDTVELVLFNQGDSEHTFHLHGYSFYVVATNQLPQSLDTKEIKKMDEENKLFPQKNLVDPAEKDTITISKYGVAALRFKADNPGYWILRDEGSNQWTRGLDVILQVGSARDFVRPPPEFPKCGSFVGPQYFLI